MAVQTNFKFHSESFTMKFKVLAAFILIVAVQISSAADTDPVLLSSTQDVLVQVLNLFFRMVNLQPITIQPQSLGKDFELSQINLIKITNIFKIRSRSVH